MSPSDQQNPENPGSNDPAVTRFIFDTTVAASARRDLELRVSAIEARLNTIVEGVQIGGTPILLPLIHMTKGDGDELARLGKALQRVAEILPELTEVRSRLGMVKLAEDDPAWLASVFGDFSADLAAFVDEQHGGDPPAHAPDD